jgi:DNA-binding Lrp family transcriptional regulator
VGVEATANVKTAQLASLITELGPNISEIARQLGQFKESVRYRYKEKLLNKGFSLRVAVDHEKLGLRRLVMVFEFSDQVQPVVEKFFRLMSEEAYVVSYEKVLPDGRYLVHASVPDEYVEAYREFLGSLQAAGYVKSIEFHSFAWFRNVPMKTEMYDFDQGRWDFDWSPESRYDRASASHFASSKERFDSIDLRVLKELQKDGNKTLAQMAIDLRVNYKTLTWHFRNHIEERKLIRGYVINWLGSRYESRLGKALHKKHKYVYIAALFSNMDAAKKIEVMSRMNKLPFMWSEAAGEEYEAELAFPIESFTEGLHYIAEVMSSVKVTGRYYIIDQAHSMSFSIIPKLYDDAKQTWRFDKIALMALIDSLLTEQKKQAA